MLSLCNAGDTDGRYVWCSRCAVLAAHCRAPLTGTRERGGGWRARCSIRVFGWRSPAEKRRGLGSSSLLASRSFLFCLVLSCLREHPLQKKRWLEGVMIMFILLRCVWGVEFTVGAGHTYCIHRANNLRKKKSQRPRTREQRATSPCMNVCMCCCVRAGPTK